MAAIYDEYLQVCRLYSCFGHNQESEQIVGIIDCCSLSLCSTCLCEKHNSSVFQRHRPNSVVGVLLKDGNVKAPVCMVLCLARCFWRNLYQNWTCLPALWEIYPSASSASIASSASPASIITSITSVLVSVHVSRLPIFPYSSDLFSFSPR